MRGDIFIHIYPACEQDHEFDYGADCWCEPIVESQITPSNLLPINICVHQRELIHTNITVRTERKNFTEEDDRNFRLGDPPPGRSEDDDEFDEFEDGEDGA